MKINIIEVERTAFNFGCCARSRNHEWQRVTAATIMTVSTSTSTSKVSISVVVDVGVGVGEGKVESGGRGNSTSNSTRLAGCAVPNLT
jgi:hypothetical protein